MSGAKHTPGMRVCGDCKRKGEDHTIIYDAEALSRALLASNAAMRKALERIANWNPDGMVIEIQDVASAALAGKE